MRCVVVKYCGFTGSVENQKKQKQNKANGNNGVFVLVSLLAGWQGTTPLLDAAKSSPERTTLN